MILVCSLSYGEQVKSAVTKADKLTLQLASLMPNLEESSKAIRIVLVHSVRLYFAWTLRRWFEHEKLESVKVDSLGYRLGMQQLRKREAWLSFCRDIAAFVIFFFFHYIIVYAIYWIKYFFVNKICTMKHNFLTSVWARAIGHYQFEPSLLTQ